jgi:hypothetical protein
VIPKAKRREQDDKSRCLPVSTFVKEKRTEFVMAQTGQCLWAVIVAHSQGAILRRGCGTQDEVKGKG